MTRALVITVLVACSSPSTPKLRIEAFDPPYGPLAGGTRVVIAGDGFDLEKAGQVRVIVGERIAPLANALDEHTVEFVLPPGERVGEVDVVVFNELGTVTSSAFRYSATPVIDRVDPAEVVFGPDPVTLTVTGSGFADEGAGAPGVLVARTPASDRVVESDTPLSLKAPARPRGRPRIEVTNTRGVAVKERAMRFRPSAHDGLLLFSLSQPTFAQFYDPVDNTLVNIPRTGPFTPLSTVYRDDDGEYWGADRNGGTLGRVDTTSQRLEQGTTIGFRPPALARVGTTIYGIDRWQLRFVRMNADGTYSYVGSSQFTCCGSFGLAYDGTTLYFTSRGATAQEKVINTIDPETGVMGTPVTLVGGGTGLHIEEMRFYQGTLYATSRDGTLVTIDPATGAVTLLAAISRANAIEVFD
jgi:hypothetical protein